MKKKNVFISGIILVVEEDKKYLSSCISSLHQSALCANIEIKFIIVLNGTSEANINLDPNLKVRFIKNRDNQGFAKGINIGSRYVESDWFFIINPDTIAKKNLLKNLIEYTSIKNVAIIAPKILTDEDKLEYTILPEVNLKNIFLEQTYVYKLFPSHFEHSFSNRKLYMRVKNISAVSGVCMLIRMRPFHDVKGFDENFFLYFEDLDLCKRFQSLGLKIKYTPSAEAIHYEHQSFHGEKNGKIYIRSMKYYLRKYYSTAYVYICFIILFWGFSIRLVVYSVLILMSRTHWFHKKAKIRYLAEAISHLFLS